MAVVADPQQQLSWEARRRRPAGIAALIAAVCILGGSIWSTTLGSDFPRAPLVESLANVQAEGAIGGVESERIPGLEWIVDHFGALLAIAGLQAIGWIALGLAVTFLAAATRARRPEFPGIAMYVPLVGAILMAISLLLGAVGTNLAISDVLDGPRTVDTVRDIGGQPLLSMAAIFELLGPLVVGVGIVLVSLNAMRAGLLTRFLGILGMISGAFIGLNVGPAPILQTFWLVAVALLFFGYAPGAAGVPPAWRTGQAEPWPSQQELAEARRAEQARRRGEDPAAEPEPEPEPVAAGTAHPSSRKRKRKRRG